jgi:hypothetical protein
MIIDPIEGGAKIKPYKLIVPEEGKHQGANMYPLYRNLFICARKKSGKTHLLGRILENMSNKMTNVYIFCPTVEIDPTYKHIIESLEKKKVNVVTFKDIVEEGVNNLQMVMQLMREEIEEENKPVEEEEEKIEKNPIIKTGTGEEEEKIKKERKPKKIANKNIIVIDDSSHAIHLPVIESLLKTNRHFKAMVIISNQSVVGLSPASRKQFDDIILLPSHRADKLKTLYQDMDLNITFEEFYEMYKDVTKEPYQFLNINVRNSTFRKNFEFNIMVGEGIVDNIKNVYNKTKQLAKNLIYGIDDYNETARRILKQYGDKEIKRIVLGRYPIASQSLLEKSLKLGNIFNMDTWNKSGQQLLNEMEYDKLYHLYSIVYVDGHNTGIIVEKQTQVRIEINTGVANKARIAKERGEYQELEVSLQGKKITLSDLVNNTRKRMGDEKFFKYQSFSTNCQHFLSNMLEANGLQTGETKEFIYQNLKKLVEALPWWSKLISDLSTEAEARLSPQVAFGKVRPLRY